MPGILTYTPAVRSQRPANRLSRDDAAQLRLPLEPGAPGAKVTDVTPVAFVRSVRARRYILRVAPDGSARVTIPRRGSQREAERFLNANGEWLNRQRERMRRAARSREAAWQVGSTVLFRGAHVRILRVDGGAALALGTEVVHVDPARAPRPRIVAHLRSLAVRELPARVQEIAARVGLVPARVVVRDQRSRWGSCSPRGTISLNWRLVQMPPSVADYVIVHELVHLDEPNHSRRFWRRVRQACAWADEARAWLRRHGPGLL